MSLLTLFTAPKPFTDPHIAVIQRNALGSWRALGSEVDILLLGEEAGLAGAAAGLGLRHIPQVQRNAHGTPLIGDLFDTARRLSDSPLLAYVNADILLLPDFLSTARQVMAQAKHFLLVGQRWDLAVTQPLDFSAGWDARLQADIQARGRLHPRGGSDYFIFPRACFTHIPELAVGRAGWDNWMIYHARRAGWPTVDATAAITIAHQDHDYSHLPGSQPHYRQPESLENIRQAGGRRTIFTLLDTDTILKDGRLHPAPLTWQKLRRELEIFPLIRLRSYALAQLSFAIFHPRRAVFELRRWLANRKKGSC